MKLLRGDLDARQHDQHRKKDGRTRQIAKVHRHGRGVAAGFPEGRGEDLDEPEAERDLGDFAGVVLHGVRHSRSLLGSMEA